MLFMQPSDWQKFTQEREQADATGIVQAEQAGITKHREGTEDDVRPIAATS
ncbi:hypothetical protein J7I98_02650 [Streptomyces sp. ISL-98]|nr:hypothetical protein [Streptomyces sp. ISL-98]